MSERWLRWYDGTVRDGKFRIAAELSELPVCTVIGIWASLLEDASTNDPRGIACRGIEHHSLFLGISTHEIGTVWNALERVGAVRVNGDDVVITQWAKRQFETDVKDPTANKRKERWKQAHKITGTERNGLERFGTPETETETEIVDLERARDTKKVEIEATFLDFYSFYPKRQSKHTALKAYTKARRAGVSHQQIMDGLSRALRSDSRFRDLQFTPMPASWLNSGGYADEPGTPTTQVQSLGIT